MMLRKKILTFSIVMLSVNFTSCGINLDEISDDDSESSAQTTTPVSSYSRTTTINNTGTLALAFPDVSLSSALASSGSTSLSLAEEGEKLSVIKTPPTESEKKKLINKSLESDSLESCFNLAIRAFPQPACFAPNLKKNEWEAAQSSYTVTFGSTVNQLLYGDGGIVSASESNGASCSSSTINYFVESAVAIVDQGKEIFASLVCASKFYDVALPVNETTDFTDLLTEVTLPNGLSFKKASMSHEASSTGDDIYTTELHINMSDGTKNQSLFAYFRNQPKDSTGTSKGHAVVFHAGVDDSLSSANALTLTDPVSTNPASGSEQLPPPVGNPAPPAQSSSSQGKTAVVSVTYQNTATSTQVLLHRADFVSNFTTNHPAKFITSEGAIDHSAIAQKDSGHGIATNIVDASFIQELSGTSAGKGIVGWTASYSDNFWRSFAYDVERDSTGIETAKSTFGFAKSWVATEEKVYTPTPALGMFCAWAQNSSNPNPQSTSTTSKHLSGGGLSGTAQNLVQLQVSTRANSTSIFQHDEAQSFLKYEIAADCGSTTSVNNLVSVTSDGSVTSSFTAPSLSTFTPLGGVTLKAENIDLSHE
ncbi:MAG: hypothetical protein AB8C84_08885 [Oligoflexales bacterium]